MIGGTKGGECNSRLYEYNSAACFGGLTAFRLHANVGPAAAELEVPDKD